MAILHFLVPQNAVFPFHDNHPQPGISDYRPAIWKKHQEDGKLHVVITRLADDAYPDAEASFEMQTAFVKDIYQSFLDLPWDELAVRGIVLPQERTAQIIALQHGHPTSYQGVQEILGLAFGGKEEGVTKPWRLTVLEDGSLLRMDERDFEVYGGNYVENHAEFRKETREKITALQLQANEENDGTTSSLLGRLLDALDVLDQNAPQ